MYNQTILVYLVDFKLVFLPHFFCFHVYRCIVVFWLHPARKTEIDDDPISKLATESRRLAYCRIVYATSSLLFIKILLAYNFQIEYLILFRISNEYFKNFVGQYSRGSLLFRRLLNIYLSCISDDFFFKFCWTYI